MRNTQKLLFFSDCFNDLGSKTFIFKQAGQAAATEWENPFAEEKKTKEKKGDKGHEGEKAGRVIKNTFMTLDEFEANAKKVDEQKHAATEEATKKRLAEAGFGATNEEFKKLPGGDTDTKLTKSRKRGKGKDT